jgi:hypothetical protein
MTVIEKVARAICSAHINGDRSRCSICYDEKDCDWQGCEVFAVPAIQTVLREMMAFSAEPSQISKTTIENRFVQTFANQHGIEIGEED